MNKNKAWLSVTMFILLVVGGYFVFTAENKLPGAVIIIFSSIAVFVNYIGSKK